MAEPLSRRRLLGAVGGGVVLGSALGAGGATWVHDDAPAAPADSTHDLAEVPVTGAHQGGIAVPATPQANALFTIADLADPSADLGGLFAAIQQAILDVRDDPAVCPDGPGDLTVAIGLGPRVVRALSPQLPGAESMPDFDGDAELASSARGGDVLIAVHASDPGLASRATAYLRAAVPQLRTRWQQRGFRGPGTGTIVRNPLGHLDGVIVPRGTGELAENVWIGDGPVAGGTICVIRRLRLDVPRFTRLPVAEQEQTIGRRRSDGRPLSGGKPTGQVDLTAKTPEGQYEVPLRSHARAAHPSFTGSALMLRRGYAFDNGLADGGTHDEGLLFVCFQRDLQTFVKTQQRLDEQDDLMKYATPTASASFLMLPGFTDSRPLGASLLEVAGS